MRTLNDYRLTTNISTLIGALQAAGEYLKTAKSVFNSAVSGEGKRLTETLL
ncbi:MAG: hypothetical protein NWS22_08615 [Porticoccaceae bacterium]|nr:hypothetical protein [Porticoccaceae bacterium]